MCGIISKPKLNEKLKCKMHWMEVQVRKNRFRVSRDMNDYPIRGLCSFYYSKCFSILLFSFFFCFHFLRIHFSNNTFLRNSQSGFSTFNGWNGDGCMRYEYDPIEMRLIYQFCVWLRCLFALAYISIRDRIYLPSFDFSTIFDASNRVQPSTQHLVCILTQTILCMHQHSTLQSGHTSFFIQLFS